MNLKSFVKRAIVDIVGAVEEAEKESGREIHFPTKEGENIQFDVAVTAEDSGKADAGIQILKIVKGGMNSETKNSTTSRLSFSLLISSLSKEEKARNMDATSNLSRIR